MFTRALFIGVSSAAAMLLASGTGHAGPADPTAANLIANALPGETTSTSCNANGFVVVRFNNPSGGGSTQESSTPCTPGASSGGGSTGGTTSTSGSGQTQEQAGEETARNRNDDAGYEITTTGGGSDRIPASEFDDQQRGYEEDETEYGVGREDGEEDEEDGGGGGGGKKRFTEVQVKIPASLPVITEEQQDEIDAFVGRVNNILAAEEAFKAAEQAVADAEKILSLTADAAAADAVNDLYNFGVGQAMGLLGDGVLGKTVGPDTPEHVAKFRQQLVGIMGDKATQAFESETPESMKRLLANQAGTEDADAIAGAVNAFLGAAAEVNPALEPIAGIAEASLDVAKQIAKTGVSIAQLAMLQDVVDTQRDNLAQNHSGAVGGALRALTTGPGAAVLGDIFEHTENLDQFVATNDTKTSLDVDRYTAIKDAYAEAKDAAFALVKVTQEHIGKADYRALYDGVKQNIQQTVGRGGAGSNAARAAYTQAYEGPGQQRESFETRLATALEVVAGRFSPPGNPQFAGLETLDFTTRLVEVKDQVRDQPEIIAPSNVAFIGNMRVYADLGVDRTIDKRGAANMRSTGVSVGGGMDTRLSDGVVAGVAIRVSHSNETDVASQLDIASLGFSITPYATIELDESFYVDSYVLYGWGDLDADATDGTGDSGSIKTQKWGAGLGLNWKGRVDEATKVDLRLGGGLARSWSDALVLPSRVARPANGSTSGTVVANVKLDHQRQNWSFQPALQLTQRVGSVSRTVERFRARPQLGATYRFADMAGVSLSGKTYYEFFQSDLETFGGSVSLSVDF